MMKSHFLLTLPKFLRRYRPRMLILMVSIATTEHTACFRNALFVESTFAEELLNHSELFYSAEHVQNQPMDGTSLQPSNVEGKGYRLFVVNVKHRSLICLQRIPMNPIAKMKRMVTAEHRSPLKKHYCSTKPPH